VAVARPSLHPFDVRLRCVDVVAGDVLFVPAWRCVSFLLPRIRVPHGLHAPSSSIFFFLSVLLLWYTHDENVRERVCGAASIPCLTARMFPSVLLRWWCPQSPWPRHHILVL
jgi:hypothetical protein